MRRFARAWVALWDRREPAHALAIVRIAVALAMLHDFLLVWHLDLVGPIWSGAPEGSATGAGGGGPALWLGMVIALVAVATGTLTRVACVGAALISAQLAHLAPDTDRGIDVLMRVVLPILALSRSHAVWSVDAWVLRRLGRPMSVEIPAWPRYLLFAQLVWVYFSGGHNKTGIEWGWEGGYTALANALADPHFARFGPEWVAYIDPLTRVATAVTMGFELGAPLILVLTYYAATRDRPGRIRRWCNRLLLRWIWIAIGVSFHLGIALTMRLGLFPWGMLALYPVLLFPDEIAAVLARFRRRPE